MRLDQLIAARPRTLSFEFFPPPAGNTPEAAMRNQILFEHCIEQLVELGPDFLSMTYGAGGTTRDRSLAAITRMRALAPTVPTLAHLTCVGATRDEMRGLLDQWAAAGIENILALRGDPPRGTGPFTPVPGGFAYAGDLISAVRADGRFAIACAAFPEGHPEASDRTADWHRLAGKFAAGACMAITQIFLDPADWRAMRSWLDANGHAGVRVVPGIMPIQSWPWLVRFRDRFSPNLGIPDALRRRLEPLAADPIASRKEGMRVTIELAADLLRAGAPGLHVCTLNRPAAAAELVTAVRTLGLID